MKIVLLILLRQGVGVSEVNVRNTKVDLSLPLFTGLVSKYLLWIVIVVPN